MGSKNLFRHHLTGFRFFDILELGPDLWGPNAIRSIDTARVHHAPRRRGRSMVARARAQRPAMPEVGYLSRRAKAILMQATSRAVRLLPSFSCAMLAAPAVGEDTGVGPPPALAPGQAPPLPQASPLAEPRSSDQVGFPTVLTEYAISPATLRPAR